MSNRIFYKACSALLATALLLSSCAKQPETTPPIPYTTTTLSSGEIKVEQGDAYYLPLGEGKYVPSDDAVWKDYLDGQVVSSLEHLSMPFVAVDRGENALVYVLENPYRTEVSFTCEPDIRLTLTSQPSSLAPSEESTVRVYTTENNAVAVAAAYKSYLQETGGVLTLAQKAEANPNVAALYGAPHIYLWGDLLLSHEDVKWQEFIKSASSPVLAHVNRLLAGTDAGTAFAEALSAVAGQDFVDNYQRGVLLGGLSTAMLRPDFYDSKVFPNSNNTMEELLKESGEALHPAKLIELNKHALYENMSGVFEPVEGWYDYDSVDILSEMKAAGIDTAWIGLASDGQSYHKPQLAKAAVARGYLIGPYDSYHSIHAPGEEEWDTAAFPDKALYENATVENEAGEKISGFQGVGRKLNPTLALPSVQQRVSKMLQTGISFNSWFVDCDATGEVYDDYSPEHPTTKQQDVAARLERMDYIAQEHGMVVGSEGGNDFAANSIAFAHGIEMPAFSWMDKDMTTNKNSNYYLGRYYSPNGGAPEKFINQVPVKEKFQKLFIDISYHVPLFALVYNDSVITSYHWEWPTLKVAGVVEDRMLREVLYNVPPMYHLDRAEWDKNKDTIVAHNAVWSDFSAKAVTKPMTNFAYLTDDRLIQTTTFGSDLQAVANFSDREYKHDTTPIPPHSVLIIDKGTKQIYTP